MGFLTSQMPLDISGNSLGFPFSWGFCVWTHVFFSGVSALPEAVCQRGARFSSQVREKGFVWVCIIVQTFFLLLDDLQKESKNTYSSGKGHTSCRFFIPFFFSCYRAVSMAAFLDPTKKYGSKLFKLLPALHWATVAALHQNQQGTCFQRQTKKLSKLHGCHAPSSMRQMTRQMIRQIPLRIKGPCLLEVVSIGVWGLRWCRLS